VDRTARGVGARRPEPLHRLSSCVSVRPARSRSRGWDTAGCAGLFAVGRASTDPRDARRRSLAPFVVAARTAGRGCSSLAVSSRETEIASRDLPCGGHGRRPGRVRSCRVRHGVPGGARRSVYRTSPGHRGRRYEHRDHLERRAAGVSPLRDLLGQPRRRRRALRHTDGAGARCSRPTSACSRLRTRKPHPAHHPAWMRRGVAVSRTDDPLRRTAHGVRGRASDASVTPSIVGRRRSRGRRLSLEVASSSPPRSRDRSRREDEPRRLPSNKSPRPATSFRTPGSGLPLAPWRCRLAASFATPFHRGETSRTSTAGPPCTRPVAGGSRFLDLGFACRLLLIGERRADSPWRAFDPRRCELP